MISHKLAISYQFVVYPMAHDTARDQFISFTVIFMAVVSPVFLVMKSVTNQQEQLCTRSVISFQLSSIPFLRQLMYSSMDLPKKTDIGGDTWGILQNGFNKQRQKQRQMGISHYGGFIFKAKTSVVSVAFFHGSIFWLIFFLKFVWKICTLKPATSEEIGPWQPHKPFNMNPSDSSASIHKPFNTQKTTKDHSDEPPLSSSWRALVVLSWRGPPPRWPRFMAHGGGWEMIGGWMVG